MFFKIIVLASFFLNFIFILENFLPKNLKFDFHNYEKLFNVLTDNKIYEFFFPTPSTPQNPNFILALYQAMKDIHEILSYANIVYYTDGGTTLGVVRHKGLIPWDNDLDICLLSEYELKFQSMIPVFKKAGYDVSEVSFGYKITTQKYYTVIVKNQKTQMRVCCDIFLATRHNDNMFYLKVTARDQWPKAFHKLKDLFPLVKRFFGNVPVYTPKNPVPYLDRYYGKDWKKIGYEATHAEEVSLKAFKIKSFEPAKPLSPLQDRIHCG